ncbi:melanocyte protein PMEL-like isoform X2 [Etheostoma spectabile]|uniref:melanocyte protein PMEL-like isoform X2 n=1 Tax=Etheostoma spectabile TaxID=54343 RepID=UPI0013AF5689|nr:melanocyte protein PMEL-like isoform X2 [Etheostoma spectabile]XP_032368251.1 melanocyte protein PMEL-like isoform X2 [Etheostoma spectabile]
MRTLELVLLVLAFTFATATRPRSQFTRYRSWNSRMYPVWKDGDQRFRNCWFGGEVTFDLKNDAPTLTGARTTFNINLNFPPNQTALPDGQVVWAQNCSINGQQYQEGQAVYPDRDTQSTGVFPDGTRFSRSQNKKPHYVFVWKTWGRYWQVADGPSSSLTIGTDNIPLGSYNMEVVIYHSRGKDTFIPLGYASTVFAITDQIPFTMSLAQVNDVNQADQNFIQNRAIAFNVKLHDPSQYLNNADLSFSWDFGDSTGTLISRETTVTHTYLAVGTFKPQVVLMASISNGCGNPTAVAPIDASAASVVVIASTLAAEPAAPAEAGDAIALDVPASDTTPLAASMQPADAENGEAVVDAEAVEVASVAPAGVNAAVVPEEQDPAEDANPAAGEVATVAPIVPAAEEPADVDTTVADETAVVTDTTEENAPVIDAAASVAPVAEGEEAVVEVAGAVTVAPAAEVAVEQEAPAATETTAIEEAAPAGDTEAEVQATENEVAATTAPAEQPAGEEEAVAAEGEVQAEVETDPAQVALVVAKRQAPELTADCMVYRYGSLATSLDVVQGIESVQIVQMSNVVAMATELNQNAVDVTITCQGSLPSEVCTVISDADCITPVETVCNAATPSPDCQMVLRQFFNDSGVFCINVSLTNDVSLAVASARVSVTLASSGSPAGTAATVLGVMVLACVVCCIGLMYRRFKQYQPLREDHGDSNGGSSVVTSVPLMLWNLLSRQSPGESRPLLQGRIV